MPRNINRLGKLKDANGKTDSKQMVVQWKLLLFNKEIEQEKAEEVNSGILIALTGG